jgi:hypothetical protein
MGKGRQVDKAAPRAFDHAETLSASIEFYRPQATSFVGRFDGKLSKAREEVSCFQMLTGAGDD